MCIQIGSDTTPTRKSADARPMIKVCVTAFRSHLFEAYAPMTRPFPEMVAITRNAYDASDTYSSAEERTGCTWADVRSVGCNVVTLCSIPCIGMKAKRGILGFSLFPTTIMKLYFRKSSKLFSWIKDDGSAASLPTVYILCGQKKGRIKEFPHSET